MILIKGLKLSYFLMPGVANSYLYSYLKEFSIQMRSMQIAMMKMSHQSTG